MAVDQPHPISIADGKKYVIGDAVNVLSSIDDADVICLDDAWSRPYRGGQFGVEYDTHPFDHEDEESPTSTKMVVDACMDALKPGGWLIADADDWLLPRLTSYLMEEYGDVNEDYGGGGYRKVGGVTYLSSDGTPDRSTPGMYGSTGGYSVVFGHKGETERRWSESVRQVVPRQREKFGWGSVKPIVPYQKWVGDILNSDDHLVVPCAGTAPAALGAEIAFGSSIRYTCIDNEPNAYNAFRRRARQEATVDTKSLEFPEIPNELVTSD